MTQRRRKTGLIVLTVLIVAVWVAALSWLALQPERTEGTLGMADETGQGAAAITSVLADQGIAVRPAQSMTQLRSELQRDAAAMVLFHDQHQAMVNTSYERLEALAELVPAEQRVFAGVSGAQADYLLSGVVATQSTSFVENVRVEETCTLPAALEAGDVSAVRHGVLLDDTAHGCFGIEQNMLADEDPAWAYAETVDGSVVFADWRMLSNAGLSDNGTATLAAWSLGRADTVVWFQPDFQFDPDADGQLSPVQLPDWARMSIVWTVIVTGIWLLYRGRRTGPVIVEPLPAEVPSAETILGRGRLAAKAKHRNHAMTTLQQAALVRLARAFRLGEHASVDAVLQATAAHTDKPLAELHKLYAPPTGQLSAQEFLTLATQVQDLENQVRDHLSAPTKESL